jgi:hypothetical protein
MVSDRPHPVEELNIPGAFSTPGVQPIEPYADIRIGALASEMRTRA